MSKVRLKKDDTVVVIAGRDKGKVGKILKVFPRDGYLLVEGINLLTHHVKPSQADPEGGLKRREGKIHISNVAYYDAATSRPTRLSYKMDDGVKKRYSVRSKTFTESAPVGK